MFAYYFVQVIANTRANAIKEGDGDADIHILP